MNNTHRDIKLVIFDRKKYLESIKKLRTRNAPNYVIEAYENGFSGVVNAYYKLKLTKKRSKRTVISESKRYRNLAKNIDLNFVQEAVKKSDLDFIKAFFQMTNMDIVSGRRIPPNAGKLLKQDIVKSLGLKDLYKKLK